MTDQTTKAIERLGAWIKKSEFRWCSLYDDMGIWTVELSGDEEDCNFARTGVGDLAKAINNALDKWEDEYGE